MIRHVRYGPKDRYLDPPAAGMCMSVFAVVSRNGQVLVGRPAPHRAWKSKWLFSWAFFAPEELREAYVDRRLPSSYLLEGEDPRHGLERIMKDQLGVGDFTATGPRVFSYVAPSDWYPGHDHWDLAFVYDVLFDGPVKRRPWWKELRFEDRAALRAEEFGWNADFVKDIGVAEK